MIHTTPSTSQHSPTLTHLQANGQTAAILHPSPRSFTHPRPHPPVPTLPSPHRAKETIIYCPLPPTQRLARSQSQSAAWNVCDGFMPCNVQYFQVLYACMRICMCRTSASTYDSAAAFFLGWAGQGGGFSQLVRIWIWTWGGWL